MDFKESLEAIEQDDSSFRIRITLMDDTLIFDSRTISYPVGANIVIGVIPNVDVGNSQVSLSFFRDIENDISSGGMVRIVHTSVNSSAVDIIRNDDALIASNLGFSKETGYLKMSGACCLFSITATGTSDPILNEPSFYLRTGRAITMLLMNNLGAAYFNDDIRPISTAAKVRAINATSMEGFMEFYAVPEGGSMSEATPIDIHYWGDEDYNYLAAGDYDLIAVSADTENVLAETPITVANGDIYTYVLHEAQSGGQPLGIITLDGAAP